MMFESMTVQSHSWYHVKEILAELKKLYVPTVKGEHG